MNSNLYFWLILLSLFISGLEKANAQSPDWLWAKSIDSETSDGGEVRMSSISVDPITRGVYTTGKFAGTVDFDPGPDTFNLTSTYGGDIFISKLDSAGNFLWAGALEGDFIVWPQHGGVHIDMAVDPGGTGDVYIAGIFFGTIDVDPGPDTFNLTSNELMGTFISKLNKSGNFVWAKSLGAWVSKTTTGSGYLYMTGTFSGTEDFNPGPDTFNLTANEASETFIAKLDSLGNFIWAKSFGRVINGLDDFYYRDISLDPSGNGYVYTTGDFRGTADFDPGPDTFNLTSTGGDDIFISKLDSSGNFIWAKSLGGSGADHSTSIAIGPNGSGDVYTTGKFSGIVDFDPSSEGIYNLINNGNSYFISKLDSLGNFEWAKQTESNPETVRIDPENGDVYYSGDFTGPVNFNLDEEKFTLTSNGWSDIFITKLDDSGNFIWAKAVGSPGLDYGSIALDALGYVYLAGSFFGPSISLDSITLMETYEFGDFANLFIAKLDNSFTTSVANVESKIYQINIYPNPATNELTIGFDGDGILNVGIIIFNVLGEVVYLNQNEFISHQKTIDISSLSTGIHFVELNINGNRLVQKVVKE